MIFQRIAQQQRTIVMNTRSRREAIEVSLQSANESTTVHQISQDDGTATHLAEATLVLVLRLTIMNAVLDLLSLGIDRFCLSQKYQCIYGRHDEVKSCPGSRLGLSRRSSCCVSPSTMRCRIL